MGITDLAEFKFRKLDDDEAHAYFMGMGRVSFKLNQHPGTYDAWLQAARAYFKRATELVHLYYKSGDTLYTVVGVDAISVNGDAQYRLMSMGQLNHPFNDVVDCSAFFKPKQPTDGLYSEIVTEQLLRLESPLLTYRTLLDLEESKLCLFYEDGGCDVIYFAIPDQLTDGQWYKVLAHDPFTQRMWTFYIVKLSQSVTEQIYALLSRNLPSHITFTVTAFHKQTVITPIEV